MKTNISRTVNEELRVLKMSSCPSLSGKSKLQYEIGCGPAADLWVRISKNTGTGYFSKDWVAWDRLRAVLDKNAGKPITCHTLGPLFKGQSVNTAGFLLAALKHEGLVQAMEDKPRCYELLDATAFFAELQALMDSPVVSPGKARSKTNAPGKKGSPEPV